MERLGLGIGISNFQKLVQQNCLFVDKSLFIEDVLKDDSEVKLFLRPRRFGKSLNLSMLHYFFSIKGATENKELFKGLKIENSPYFSEQGKYPVIYLDMKDLGKTYEELKSDLNVRVREAFKAYGNIIKSSDVLQDFDKNDCLNILNDKEFKAHNAIKLLCNCLYQIYGQNVIVLIDEYDAPLVKAYEYGYYNDAVELLSKFYGTLLKNNKYLKFAVIVGIVRYSKTSIYSSLNNLAEYNILTKSFDEFFGFTEDEVKDALKKYNLDSNLDSVRDYYAGYKFGDMHIYNPWSITNYLRDKELVAYWVGTSKNFLIKDLLKIADESIFDRLKILLNGGSIEGDINLTLTLDQKLNKNEIWSLLFFAGYLTIDDTQKVDPKSDKNKLKIPNKDVFTDFVDILSSTILPENLDVIH